MILIWLIAGICLILMIFIGCYLSYQFLPGNWKLFIDYHGREYDCEACEGLPMMLKRQVD